MARISWLLPSTAILSMIAGVFITFGVVSTNTTIAYYDPPDDLLVSFQAESQKIADFIAVLAIWEAPDIPKPDRNAEALAYAAANQPGQSWRSTVDAYRHVDPGRRMI